MAALSGCGGGVFLSAGGGLEASGASRSLGGLAERARGDSGAAVGGAGIDVTATAGTVVGGRCCVGGADVGGAEAEAEAEGTCGGAGRSTDRSVGDCGAA